MRRSDESKRRLDEKRSKEVEKRLYETERKRHAGEEKRQKEEERRSQEQGRSHPDSHDPRDPLADYDHLKSAGQQTALGENAIQVPLNLHQGHAVTDFKTDVYRNEPQVSKGKNSLGLDDHDQAPGESYSETFRKISRRIINLQRFGIPLTNLGRPVPEPPEEKKHSGDADKDKVKEIPWVMDEETKKLVEKVESTEQDKVIAAKLSEVLEHYQGNPQQKAANLKKIHSTHYSYNEIVDELNSTGIPVPTDEDFARLEPTHGSRWDPDGTVVEYYSPVLRSFIPLNMRGRYRGCWAEDQCIQGLDISKLGPKPDVLEGFVDRGRKTEVEKKYRAMYDVANDEAHLEYLLEIQKMLTEVLPLPILFDVLNFGAEVLKENMNIIIEEERLPGKNWIYETTEQQTKKTLKRIEMYAALGMEPANQNPNARSGGGVRRLDPLWEKNRNQLMSDVIEDRRQKAQMKKSEFARKRVFDLPGDVDPLKTIDDILQYEREQGVTLTQNSGDKAQVEKKKETQTETDQGHPHHHQHHQNQPNPPAQSKGKPGVTKSGTSSAKGTSAKRK